jgi:hypothetical protein
VLEHEACHVYSVQAGVHPSKEQSHGQPFQSCMARYGRPTGGTSTESVTAGHSDLKDKVAVVATLLR